jgi:hypothetical protein
MSEADVQTSIRRMTALLLVPLSLVVAEIGIHLREQHGITGGWKSEFIAGSQAVSALLVVGAVGYLLVSVLTALAGSVD